MKKRAKKAANYMNVVFYIAKQKIILEGFEGDDKFLIFENTKSNIGIEMNGGKGNDVYEVNAKLKNRISDNKTEQNNIIHGSNSRGKTEVMFPSFDVNH